MCLQFDNVGFVPPTNNKTLPIFLYNCHCSSRTMKQVAVIGAGAAGLAALRSMGRFDDTLEYVAYETSDRVGGTWILNDPFKPTSMYNNLR